MDDRSTPLGHLLPALLDQPGAPEFELLGGPLFRHLDTRGCRTWAELAGLSLGEIEALPHVGPVRVERIWKGLAALSTPVATAPDVVPRSVLDALVAVASWAVGTGGGGSLLAAIEAASASSDLDAPGGALDALRSVDVGVLADPALVEGYDPVLAAERIIDLFDDRERAILDRVLDFDGNSPTLEQIGTEFGVTRERIRQIQQKVEQRIERELTGRSTALVHAAARLRERLGAAIPADQLAAEFAEYPPDLVDRLILHVAGPYHFAGDWYVLDELTPLDRTLKQRFAAVEVDGVAPLPALLDAFAEMGVRPEFCDRLLAECSWLHRIGDDMVDWRGSMADKAVRLLSRAREAMTFEELAALVEPTSDRGLANQVSADSRIVRVGVRRHALTTWGDDAFVGIVPAMAERLRSGPRPIAELGAELAAEYGAKPSSVQFNANLHPAFVADGAMVRLRGDDEPYEVDTDLASTAGCYVVDGVWSWRVPVDWDVLRGSARWMPEAFAAHLGVRPLAKSTIDSTWGPIALSWTQTPHFGSIRRVARDLGAELGDWLFVRRVTPSSVDIRLLAAGDVPGDADGRLRALVGASGRSGSLERVLADALDLRGTVNHDLSEERAMLVTRKETKLVQLLDEVASAS